MFNFQSIFASGVLGFVMMIALACSVLSSQRVHSKTNESGGHGGIKSNESTEARSASQGNGVEFMRLRHEDRHCKGAPLTLRHFFYKNFAEAVNKMSPNEKKAAVDRYGKALGMAVAESAGNAAAICDMKLNGSAKSGKLFSSENKKLSPGGMLQSTLGMREELLNLSEVNWDKQTNFGILQMSADRLIIGKQNAEIFNRYRNLMARQPSAALEKCGSRYFYKDSVEKLLAELKKASECRAGTNKASEVKCFGRMVTICPALNLELALNAPAKYFATRRTPARCTEALKEAAGLR